ncbi:MAG: efflux RND transporter periplasmic adaptor subunit [Agarilytica sp.]
MNLQKLNSNMKLALAMTAALVLWMLLGLIAEGPNDIKIIDETEKRFRVEVENIQLETFRKKVNVRGRTEAVRRVRVAAEIDGRIIATPAQEGSFVKQGDALCVLDSEDRELRLAQARALLNKAEIDYQGALSLKDRGFQSQTQIASAKANLAVAKADVKAMRLATEKLTIRAPFDGFVQERLIDAGGFIQRGSPCAQLVDLSQLKVVGLLSESALSSIVLDGVANVLFSNGESAIGRVQYLASAANAVTRTFKIEIYINNPGYALRDGMSADVHIQAKEISAHHLSPSLLSLTSDEKIAVKVIEGENRVVIKPIEIIGDDEDGVWVTGLEENTQLITIGQEYVSQDDVVDVVAPVVPVSLGANH